MLKPLKRGALRVARATGANALLARSRWRSERVLILCYHGISISDEHEWDSELYMSQNALARRLELLKKHRCSVLPLEEALGRTAKGTLPPRSVVLTFDDGAHDFHSQAIPVLKSFGFPATVYLTSFYCEFNRPIFYLACSYLLWKHRARMPAGGPARVLDELRSWLDGQKPSAEEQQARLRQLARSLGSDISELTERRILHLMTPEEVSDAARQGFDIQLHTHRHRTPSRNDLFARELTENGDRIRDWAGQNARHFCYPNGTVRREFPGWLRDLGVASAVTCVPGLASAQDDPLLLPRLVDHSGLSEVEFTSWLSGSGAWLRSLRGLKMVESRGLQKAAV